MANVKTTMTDIRVIIREFLRGTSLSEMEKKTETQLYIPDYAIVGGNPARVIKSRRGIKSEE